MLTLEDLGKLLREFGTTRDEEVSCDECFTELDRFVEVELAGLDAASAMPLIRDHLDRCGDCREEYQALLVALRAERGRTPVRLVWDRLRNYLRPDREPG